MKGNIRMNESCGPPHPWLLPPPHPSSHLPLQPPYSLSVYYQSLLFVSAPKQRNCFTARRSKWLGNWDRKLICINLQKRKQVTWGNWTDRWFTERETRALTDSMRNYCETFKEARARVAFTSMRCTWKACVHVWDLAVESIYRAYKHKLRKNLQNFLAPPK